MANPAYYVLFLAALAATTTAAFGRAPEHGRRVVCYMASWGIYLHGAGRFDISDVEGAASMCTHLVYLFALLDGQTFKVKPLDANRDLSMGGIATSVALKEKFPHLNVMICIGGWNDGSINYSNMVKSPENRALFIASIEEYVLTHHLDGVDMNWQFPGDRGGSTDDRHHYVTFIKELRDVLDKHDLILSVAVTSFPWRMDLGTDAKGLAEHAHFLNVLSYEYHAWWDSRVGSSTPLNAADHFCINDTIHRYLSLGAPAQKLNLGLSSYGTTFVISNPNSAKGLVGQTTAGQGFKGIFNDVDGFMAYNELCLEMEAGGWNTIWDKASETPFAINGARVVSYDNNESYTAKVQFAMEKQLGGVIYYGLEKDDFRGDCSSSKGPYPCLRSIHQALLQHSKISYDDLLILLKKQNAHFFWNGMTS